jgi:hypothetical protein
LLNKPIHKPELVYKRRIFFIRFPLQGWVNFQPEMWVSFQTEKTDGKVKDEYHYGFDYILDGFLNVSSMDQWRVQNKHLLIKKYRALDILPEKIKCPQCFNKIKLYRQEIMDRKFKCSNCLEDLDLTFDGEKV